MSTSGRAHCLFVNNQHDSIGFRLSPSIRLSVLSIIIISIVSSVDVISGSFVLKHHNSDSNRESNSVLDDVSISPRRSINSSSHLPSSKQPQPQQFYELNYRSVNGWPLTASSSSDNLARDDYPPRFEGLKPDEGFHAIVRENDRTVIISPRIKVVNGDLCNIEILNKHHGDIPFEVKITDKLRGEAILEAHRELNCEKRRAYKFNIRAISCSGLRSENATVFLSVEDVNEYAPVFRQESYTVTISEGRLIDPVVRVEAFDHDCSSRFSEICKYEIIGGDKLASPFEIDSNGNIKNTRPLSWKESHNYILEVVAYDCGMKRSKPTLVNIKVNKVCQLGWKDIHERIEYIPTSGQKTLFPDAELQLCDLPCDVQDVSVQLSLATSHIGKGCDRDTYSVESQRKLCGANVTTTDLLPSPGLGTEWTRDLPTDEGHESDQIFEFDGSTSAVAIPESVLDHNLTDKFAISFWMKHEPPLDHTNKHIKEHILCNADDHKKNRHHFALFVRNCRLILLLRREFNQEKRTIFKPAEWRWKLTEVCDGKWHHYSVNVQFPEIQLYLDGQLFKNNPNNPEIVDDWPLHAMKGVNTTLTVGACWEGKANKMNFHFRGFLAGLGVMRGSIESPEVLSCLHQCRESLQMPPPDSMDSGTDIYINHVGSEILLEGKDAIDVEDMLSQITYTNSREYPTPGRRSLQLSTTIRCSNEKSVKVPTIDSYIMVLPPEQPTISLNGTPNLAREYEAFTQGIDLLSTVSILINHEIETDDDSGDDDGDDDSTNSIDDTAFGGASSAEDLVNTNNNNGKSNPSISKQISKLLNVHKVDTCSILVYPPLNPDHEFFRLPVNYMARLGLQYTESKDGIVIHGAETVRGYQEILREIVYFNRKPAYYLNRAFKLSCSELNGRFVSNDYTQTLTVIHPKIESAPINVNSNGNGGGGSIPGSASSSSSSKASNRHDLKIETISGGHPVAHAQIHDQQVEIRESKLRPNILHDSNILSTSENIARTSAIKSRLSSIVVGHTMTVIIVLCVGFLLFMIVLGVIRIRAAHHRSNDNRDEETEMAWDDSSLTITVNPLDQIDQDQENQRIPEEDDDSDSSDDGSSYRDDGESTEDEMEKPKVRKELEWDNSTLDF
ncbi:calsyntenin 1 isoform X2 [Brevipalpus obovatus]|uniref:calsyntenin 1 isoform X2 n=1 Tax=Brevipalpus obovatus TaxID=246614 RepID=UPI003D9F1EBE